MKYTYLLINIFTILFPLIFSFEKKIYFFQKWRYLWPGLLFTGLLFVVWDSWFAYNHVWSFNPKYVLGIYFLGLPLEEHLFFITTPFASVFIYEVANFYLQKDIFSKVSQLFATLLVISLSIIALVNREKYYTFINMAVCACVLLLALRANYLGKFFRAYFIHLIPFVIVNGILTALPVVMYNSNHNLGIRIYTIPIEDTVYALSLFLMNVMAYEYFKSKPMFYATQATQSND